MQNLIDIQTQIAELQRQEKFLLTQEYDEALEKVQMLITQHKIQASDLVFFTEGSSTARKVKVATAGKKAEVKYRDANGNSWTGRGLQPKWLSAAVQAGKSKEDFAVTA